MRQAGDLRSIYVEIFLYLPNDNFFLVDFLHQHLPDPSILEILEALQALIVEHVVLRVRAWIEDKVHANVNVRDSWPHVYAVFPFILR